MTQLIWILGDQLLEQHPALHGATPATTHVVLIESERVLARRYHRHKLALVLSAMRHYAEELQQAGWPVLYLRAPHFSAGLQEAVARTAATHLITMAAADWAGRHFQTHILPQRVNVPVHVVPNTQFLVGQHNPFPNPTPGKRYVLETFYRAMRRHFGFLLEANGDPLGGQWNWDASNRKPLPPALRPPAPLRFDPDALTAHTLAEVAAHPTAFGPSTGFGYATTRAQARAALADFITHRLPLFGDYEDAMSTHSATVFHAVLSPYINLGLLTPLEMARAAEHAYHTGHAPLNAAEGLVRQIIGWREYMYWQYWRLMPDLAASNHWQAHRPVPEFFWTGHTHMNCMHHVLTRALATGYTHHIERLMVLSNFAVLAGLNPQAVTAWFKAVYIDAYDWVMQSNAIGMGLNADGGQLATKPYIASANYIHTMSDYCGTCAYDRKARTGDRACPFNTLYWNFLLDNERALKANPRLGPAVLGVNRLDSAERARLRATAAHRLADLDTL